MRAFRREALRRTIEVRGDGTPLFSQDGTGFLNVFEGAGGETSHNLFSHCCGHGESLAVDSHGLAQIAFWSNATGHTGYLYGKLGPIGDLAGGLRSSRPVRPWSARTPSRWPPTGGATRSSLSQTATRAPARTSSRRCAAARPRTR